MDSSEVAALIGLVVLYTFLFDVMDLQPRIGFGYIFSLSYGFYLLFQTILGILASIVVSEALGPNANVALVALLGTLGGVTVLQNFALNVGDTNVANLAALRDTYRLRMEADEKRRQAQRKQRRELEVQRGLREFGVEQLRREFRIMSISRGYELGQANGQIEELEQASGGDETSLRASLAYYIATIDTDYAAGLRPEEPAESITDAGASSRQ